jgi:RNase adaptor protein for sRNA GlmZ degradation
MHNPGKYEQYKKITGADAPVIEFLESQGEVQRYLDNVYGLVDPAVDKYIERGFLNLMVAFGCTGGQHRSLYCANHLAEHLKEKYADRIHIVLEHREQKVRKEL